METYLETCEGCGSDIDDTHEFAETCEWCGLVFCFDCIADHIKWHEMRKGQ